MLVLLIYLTSEVPPGFPARGSGWCFPACPLLWLMRELTVMLCKWAKHTRCPEEKAVSAAERATLLCPGPSLVSVLNYLSP